MLIVQQETNQLYLAYQHIGQWLHSLGLDSKNYSHTSLYKPSMALALETTHTTSDTNIMRQKI